MHPAVITVAIAVGALVLFGVCYAGALLLTRPARPRPAAATPDLGEEPPAVVNLLANGWDLNEDAVEGTLLDLAARRFIELRQPGSDPRHTTVHLREPHRSGPELTPYEQRVLDRVRGLAVDGVVPISALTFRDKDQEKGWGKRFRKEVIADAQARGLSRRRFTGSIVGLLELVAAISAIGIAAALAHWESWGNFDEDDQGMWVPVGFIAFVVLGASVSAITGQRDTPAGVEAARRWLGVRAWLRGHDEFADLPPASVMVWDRYLAYGAALGTTHLASEVLDLGMADRKRVWSSYGGAWHRVRVRYPKLRRIHGVGTRQVFTGAVLRIAAGIGLLLLRSELLPKADLGEVLGPETLDVTTQGDQVTEYLDTGLLALGVLGIVLGGYRLVRGLIAVSTIRTITGEVLWLETWRKRRQGEDGPTVPVLYYLAIDDGSSDKTTAWALQPGLASGLVTGDTVTVRVMPWTRRVLAVEVNARGREHVLAQEHFREDAAEAVSERVERVGLSIDASKLLTKAEVEQALGMPVRMPEQPVTPIVAMAIFEDQAGKPALILQVTSGGTARLVWRLNRMRGDDVPGLGDKARHARNRIVVRVGERTVALALQSQASRGNQALPWLAQQALSRLPAATAASPGGS